MAQYDPSNEKKKASDNKNDEKKIRVNTEKRSRPMPARESNPSARCPKLWIYDWTKRRRRRRPVYRVCFFDVIPQPCTVGSRFNIVSFFIFFATLILASSPFAANVLGHWRTPSRHRRHRHRYQKRIKAERACDIATEKT